MPLAIRPYHTCTYIPLITLAAVFILIAVRQTFRVPLRIWQIMLGGAVVVLLTGQISLPDAAAAIDLSVMVFLLGMFILGEALHASGVLNTFLVRMVPPGLPAGRVLLLFILAAGSLSMLLMNDTLAIIGTPAALAIARGCGLPPSLTLLSLCCAITTGSVASPVGNPQNLIIALTPGLGNPFLVFLATLGIPTVINLILVYGVIRIYTGRTAGNSFQPVDTGEGTDPALARTATISFLLVLGLFFLYILIPLLLPGQPVPDLPIIAVAGALPVLILGPRRREILSRIDWPTLVFFAAMFVLMASVFRTGMIQAAIGEGGLQGVPAILVSSLVLSQFVSNVPFVALALPLLTAPGSSSLPYMALAAGSTLAGNLTVIGAASNVIVIQQAEQRGETLPFSLFIRVGLPLTIVQVCVVYGWFTLLSMAGW